MSSAQPDPAACSICSATAPEAAAIRFDPAWRSSTVLALARVIVQDQTFDVMPILADALEDAGCDNPIILEHCRHAASHEPDCWALALILSATTPAIHTPPQKPSIFAEVAEMVRVPGNSDLIRVEHRILWPCFMVGVVSYIIVVGTISRIRHTNLDKFLFIILVFVLPLLLIYLVLCDRVLRNRRRRRSAR